MKRKKNELQKQSTMKLNKPEVKFKKEPVSGELMITQSNNTAKRIKISDTGNKNLSSKKTHKASKKLKEGTNNISNLLRNKDWRQWTKDRDKSNKEIGQNYSPDKVPLSNETNETIQDNFLNKLSKNYFSDDNNKIKQGEIYYDTIDNIYFDAENINFEISDTDEKVIDIYDNKNLGNRQTNKELAKENKRNKFLDSRDSIKDINGYNNTCSERKNISAEDYTSTDISGQELPNENNIFDKKILIIAVAFLMMFVLQIILFTKIKAEVLIDTVIMRAREVGAKFVMIIVNNKLIKYSNNGKGDEINEDNNNNIRISSYNNNNEQNKLIDDDNNLDKIESDQNSNSEPYSEKANTETINNKNEMSDSINNYTY